MPESPPADIFLSIQAQDFIEDKACRYHDQGRSNS